MSLRDVPYHDQLRQSPALPGRNNAQGKEKIVVCLEDLVGYSGWERVHLLLI